MAVVHTGPRVRVERVMSSGQRAQYWAMVLAWTALSVYFWSWWPRSDHIGSLYLFVPLSLAFFYVSTVLCSAYLFYLGQMRRPVHIEAESARQAGIVRQVAMITLTVPGSESLDIVRRQLQAIVAVTAPHDSWILVDKVHSPEIKALAEELGALYFSRHDVGTWGQDQVDLWNQPTAPFQAKTKAGNVNSWIDAFGDDYTHFTQLDIDHIPTPSYLDRVLGYFVDPKVKWVQAPSIYGNHAASWTARGSSEQEFGLQGPLQMGFFGFCRTPFIIGSHSTYETAAIQAINGFQPTRAEDHLDTVYLAAAGHEGVFVPEVIALGDGPETFETYLAQQFAWAFSMIQVLLNFTPKMLRSYKPRQALQFLFVQTWYTFWSLSMLTLFMVPVASLVLDRPLSHVGYWEFLVHSLPLAFLSTGLWFWSRRWHQPEGIGLSWRGVVLHVARWVVVLSALVQVVLKVEKPYMITTKGMGGASHRPFPTRIMRPYLALMGVAIGACWFYLAEHGGGSSQGYLFFALKGAAILWLMLAVIVVQEIKALGRRGLSTARGMRVNTRPLALMGIMTIALVVTVGGATSKIVEALTPAPAGAIPGPLRPPPLTMAAAAPPAEDGPTTPTGTTVTQAGDRPPRPAAGAMAVSARPADG